MKVLNVVFAIFLLTFLNACGNKNSSFSFKKGDKYCKEKSELLMDYKNYLDGLDTIPLVNKQLDQSNFYWSRVIDLLKPDTEFELPNNYSSKGYNIKPFEVPSGVKSSTELVRGKFSTFLNCIKRLNKSDPIKFPKSPDRYYFYLMPYQMDSFSATQYYEYLKKEGGLNDLEDYSLSNYGSKDRNFIISKVLKNRLTLKAQVGIDTDLVKHHGHSDRVGTIPTEFNYGRICPPKCAK